jgi:hypothetical protein
MVEIYDVEDETGGDIPCSFSTFDTPNTSFDFIESTSICISDEKGRLLILKNIKK